MPILQPMELWQQTGRDVVFKDILLPVRGPPRPGERPGPDGRGGRHRPGRRRGHQLQAAAGQPLPDPRQVPRRVPPAVRRAPQPRVPHEGRLQLRRDRRRAGRVLPEDVRRLLPHLRPLRAEVRHRRRPSPAAWAAPTPRSSWSPAAAGEDVIVHTEDGSYAANIEKAEVDPLPLTAGGRGRPAAVAADGGGPHAQRRLHRGRVQVPGHPAGRHDQDAGITGCRDSRRYDD